MKSVWGIHIKLQLFIHSLRWRQSNLWTHYDLGSGQLSEVEWWRFVALFQQV